MAKSSAAKKGIIPSSPTPPKKKQESVKSKNHLLFYCAAIFIFSFVLYGQSVNYGYVLDDDLVARLNKSVQQGISGLPEIFTKNNCPLYMSQGSYRPLLMAHLAIEKQIWGFNPGISHFFNVFYYGICGALLFLVLARLFKNASTIFPLIITLLFLAHPVHTEVVANIKSRDEIFCFIFFLSSVLFLFKYLDKAKPSLLIASIISFFLALVSKESGVTFLAIVPLLLFCFSDEKLKRIFTLLLPYVGVVAVFLVIRTVVNHGTVSNKDINPLGNSLMAIHSGPERLATEIFILGKYLLLLLFPYHLTWDYSFGQIPPVGFTHPYALLSIIVCLGLLAFALLKIKDRNVFAFCILYFFITISIVSNIVVPIGSAMTERFLFVPSLSFCIAVIFLLSKLLNIDISGSSKYNTGKLYAICSALIFIYMLRTWSRESDWKDNLSLYEAGVKDAPNSARTHGALGNEYANLASSIMVPGERESMIKKGIAEMKLSLSIYPAGYQAWYNLGAAYLAEGNLKEGELATKKALLYNPFYAPAYYNVGTTQAQRREFGAALENLKMATELDSNYIEAFLNTASIYSYLKEYKKAETYYKRAYELKPDSKEYYNKLIQNERMLWLDTSSGGAQP